MAIGRGLTAEQVLEATLRLVLSSRERLQDSEYLALEVVDQIDALGFGGLVRKVKLELAGERR